MSEKDRETGSDAPEKASERETEAPGGAAKEGAGAPEAAAPSDAAPSDAAADAAKAEARAKVIAEAKARAEAAKAAKAAAASAGAGDAAGSGGGDAPASGGGAPADDAPAGDADAAKAEVRAKAVAAAKAKAEAAKAAKPKHGEPAGDQPPWMVDPVAPAWKDESEDELVKALQQEHPGAIMSARSSSGDLALTATREGLLAIAISLKQRHGFRYLVDVAGVDFPTRPERFEVVYHVYNHSTERRVRLKVSTDEATPVPSLCSVWRGVNWPEREAYDMFGIRFAGHPDLTRILLWEGFNGYPLRKEFPVEGIDTGSAIYPEYYQEGQGPVSGTGTGWKPKPAGGETAAGPKDGKVEETA